MQQYTIVSPELCNCQNCSVHKIQNINEPHDYLIAKIYRYQDEPNYVNEHQIFQLLPNTENIIRIRNNNNIQLILGDEFGPHPVYLIFDYLNREKLFKYLNGENFPQFTENMAKFIGYKLTIATKTLHENHIAHNKLDINNIMLNENFDPIIMHFKEAIMNVNDNAEFNDDFKGLAKIIAKLITNGKFVDCEIKRNKKGIKYFEVKDQGGRSFKGLKKFWKIFGPNAIPEQFQSFFNLLITHINLNYNTILNHPWINGINNDQTIQEETRQYLTKLYQSMDTNQKIFSTERYDCSEIIEEKNNEEENESLFGKIGMKSEEKKDLFKIFDNLSIRETKYKPMGNSYEYLTIEISNFNHDYSFLNKFMFKLYSNLEHIEKLKDFTIKNDKPKEDSFLSFTININLIEGKNDNNDEDDELIDEEAFIPDEAVDENEEIDQTLIINLELAKYKEKDMNEIQNNDNSDKFYLLFNYIQGEISYYYHCVKIFKEKAKMILKSFFGHN